MKYLVNSHTKFYKLLAPEVPIQNTNYKLGPPVITVALSRKRRIFEDEALGLFKAFEISFFTNIQTPDTNNLTLRCQINGGGGVKINAGVGNF